METSFKQLEANFQRKLNEYQTTYKDYMVKLKAEMGNYWNVKQNVKVANTSSSNRIPYVHEPDITQENCLHACSSDPKCKYVLFSDSGNGACAANQCIKWTKQANGLVEDNSEAKTYDIYVGSSDVNPKLVTLPVNGLQFPNVVPNPSGQANWPTIYMAVKDGNVLELTRADNNSGWDEIIQVKGTLPAQQGNEIQNIACTGDNNELSLGPDKTNYIYSGWEKPYWEDTANTTFMGNPESANMDKWKLIGESESLTACKEMAFGSKYGPFNSVVFYPNTIDNDDFKNKCYGGLPNTEFSNYIINGVYSSIPPMGATNLGGKSVVDYVVKLKQLNNELNNDLRSMESLLKKINKQQSSDPKKLAKTHKNIVTDLKKLKNDRIALNKMSEDLVSLDEKLMILNRVTKREKILYFGAMIGVLLVLGFAIKRYS